MAAKKNIRLDDLLVSQGYFSTPKEVLAAVMAKEVRVNDVYVNSAAIKVMEDADIYIKGQKQYVSRGGKKLEGALHYFNQDVTGMKCIDIGSSSGGFSDCLLQHGAAEVSCVDVNYGQLSWKLRNDPRIKVFERTNIKLANPKDLGAPFDLLVVDLSFIGLAQLIPIFAHYCRPQSVFIGLIKPQFESLAHETDHGIVIDQSVRERVVEEVKVALQAQAFQVVGVCESPITGTEGNIEYLVKAVYLG